MIVKVNHCNVCTIDVNWEHNHATDDLEASNFIYLSIYLSVLYITLIGISYRVLVVKL